MASSLFHLDRQGALHPLREAGYASDTELQDLVALHPALLGGDPEAGGGWFAIARKGAPPEGASDSPRWSVDHLFLAKDGVPTLAQTLRTADKPALGDLFGQILYYAANGGDWWPEDGLRSAFAAKHATADRDGVEALRDFIGKDADTDAFWSDVRANLAAGRIRMVFVVDSVQADLARMVDFLNAQLRDAEVWILEVSQHQGPSGQLLQTTIVGRRGEGRAPASAGARAPSVAIAASAATSPAGGAPARTGRTPAPTAAATRETWLAALRASCDDGEAAALDDLLRWMSEQYGVTSVSSSPTPTYRLSVKESGKDRFPFGVTVGKDAALNLGSLSSTRAYEAEEARRSLVGEIAAAGVRLADVDLKGDVRIPLSALASPALRTRVLAVFDGVIETMRLKEAPNAFLA